MKISKQLVCLCMFTLMLLAACSGNAGSQAASSAASSAAPTTAASAEAVSSDQTAAPETATKAASSVETARPASAASSSDFPADSAVEGEQTAGGSQTTGVGPTAPDMAVYAFTLLIKPTGAQFGKDLATVQPLPVDLNNDDYVWVREGTPDAAVQVGVDMALMKQYPGIYFGAEYLFESANQEVLAYRQLLGDNLSEYAERYAALKSACYRLAAETGFDSYELFANYAEPCTQPEDLSAYTKVADGTVDTRVELGINVAADSKDEDENIVDGTPTVITPKDETPYLDCLCDSTTNQVLYYKQCAGVPTSEVSGNNAVPAAG